MIIIINIISFRPNTVFFSFLFVSSTRDKVLINFPKILFSFLDMAGEGEGRGEE